MRTVVDPKAWRHAFAEPDEKLVLLLGENESILEDLLGRPGVRVLLGSPRMKRDGAHALELWASPLIPAISEIADLVVTAET